MFDSSPGFLQCHICLSRLCSGYPCYRWGQSGLEIFPRLVAEPGFKCRNFYSQALTFNYPAMPPPQITPCLSSPIHPCIGSYISSFQSAFLLFSQTLYLYSSALTFDPELYKESQGQGWILGFYLPSCCCWKFLLPISQPTIPGAICHEAFILSRRRMFWIRPSALCFMRPWAITGNGQGTSDFVQCHGKGGGLDLGSLCRSWFTCFVLRAGCISFHCPQHWDPHILCGEAVSTPIS